MTAAQRINGWTRRVPAWPIYPVGVAFGAWYFWLAVSGAWIDPVAELEHAIGLLALKLLVAVLAITPLRNLTRVNLVKYRRALGVTAFFLVLYHLLVWWFLEATSNNLALRRLGPLAWRRLHRLTYAAVLLGATHFVMLRKGWQLQPLIYLALIVVLLMMRVTWRRPGAAALQPGRG